VTDKAKPQRFSHGLDGFWADPDGLYVEFSELQEQEQRAEKAERELAEAVHDRDTAKADCLHLARDLKEAEQQAASMREALKEIATWCPDSEWTRERLMEGLEAVQRISTEALSHQPQEQPEADETPKWLDPDEPKCKSCAQPALGWAAADEHWNAVMGSYDAGVLCPRCFTNRSEALGIPVRWSAQAGDEGPEGHPGWLELITRRFCTCPNNGYSVGCPIHGGGDASATRSEIPSDERKSTDVAEPGAKQEGSGPGSSDEYERVARAFHGVYEATAPDHGYKTRPESRVAWSEVPEKNRALMIGTVRRLAETGVIAIPTQPAVQCNGSGRIPTGECRVAMSGPTCLNVECPPCRAPETEDCPGCINCQPERYGVGADPIATVGSQSQKQGDASGVSVDPVPVERVVEAIARCYEEHEGPSFEQIAGAVRAALPTQQSVPGLIQAAEEFEKGATASLKAAQKSERERDQWRASYRRGEAVAQGRAAQYCRSLAEGKS
jgi:hypothetical protein